MIKLAQKSPSSRVYTDVPPPPGTLRVLQITDTHLYADPGKTLLGVNTLDSFRQIIEKINTLQWNFDIVLATGDLVHDATSHGYRKLAQMLETFGVPVYCLPGNHDLPEIMRKHLCVGNVSCPSTVDINNWQLVLLDSPVPGQEGGHLADSQLLALENALQKPCDNVLISMHHQPLPVGSTWMDTMALDNGQAFFDIIEQYPQVRGVLWGHIHQSFDQFHNRIRLLASPSTCVQFTPLVDEFQVDDEPPGFRLLALLPDGSIDTEVIRVEDIPGGLELASSGY